MKTEEWKETQRKTSYGGQSDAVDPFCIDCGREIMPHELCFTRYVGYNGNAQFMCWKCAKKYE